MKKTNVKYEVSKFRPEKSLSYFRKKFERDKSWSFFVKKLPQSEEIRESLLIQQRQICPVCKKNLSKSVTVHHISYNHRCNFFKEAVNYSKDACKVCKIEAPDLFSLCLEKVLLIHKKCHKLIHT